MIGPAELQISTLLSTASSRQSYSRTNAANLFQGDRRPTMNPRLSQLLQSVEVCDHREQNDSEVTCLITDSRRVVSGALFFAIGGLRTNGNLYIEEAVDRGAVAVITEQDLGAYFPIDFVKVRDVRQALAEISREFYGRPDEQLRIAGITGTNGKTTVSMLTQHLIGGSDQVGLVGTVRYDIGKRTLPSFRTTPESVDTFALLSQMVSNACEDCVMEVSSHGIDQKRVYGLDIDVAAFLNLTRDHIDYHKTMEAYYSVKRCLFTGAIGSVPKAAVINVDCPYGKRLCGEVPESLAVVTFGMSTKADIRAEDVRLFADRTEFTLLWEEEQRLVVSPLLGRYNVSNLLASLAIGQAKGYNMIVMLERLSDFHGVPGRMESVKAELPFNVIVDYAHTDDALNLACETLTEITKGKLIVVFGCGGDRDRSKRAPMLQVALDGADQVFVTSDNPRTENIEQIFGDMHEASGSEKAQFVEDRKRAISLALDAADEGDCVLIAGKGHETFQEFDGSVTPFDDAQVARELLDLKGY